MKRAPAAPVSVVIPCWRCAGTVGRAVESVARQTEVPAEVILIDDGNSDATPARLRDIQRGYGPEWVRLLSLGANFGPAGARNAGWEAARQPYVAFLDSDTAWHPRKIELQWRWMRLNPGAALTGHPCLWVKREPPPTEIASRWSARPIRPWEQLLSNRLPASSVMLRRDVVLRFHPDRRYSEDYLCWTRLILSGGAVYRLDPTLGYYYKPPFGHSGVSGDLWTMERKELASYRLLMERKLISPLCYGLLAPYSLAKYLRRVLVSRFR